MAKLPIAGDNTTSDHNLQTWIVRVYIHCEGCKKKVFKVLQSIDGVYKTEIDSLNHKAIVTGSVDGDTLVQKLLKSGKHAEVLPESFEATAGAAHSASGKSKKKKKKPNKGETTDADNQHVDEGKEESEVATTEGLIDGAKDQEIDQAAVAAVDSNGGGGGKKKNKKKKGDKKDNNVKAPTNGDSDGKTAGNAPEDTKASMDQNLSRPGHGMVYATPYDLPPYHNYYPTPAYGMSYSTSYPSTESSYYTPPVYGYAQYHPSVYYPPPPPPPPPSYYPRSAFDDHDDGNGQGRGCTIM